MRRWLILLTGLLLSAPLAADTVHIGAAANLRYVLPAIIADFEKQQDIKIAVTYAASGNLSNQIRHGAPYQIFLSADFESVKPLVAGKLIRGQPFRFADAQLALFARQGSEVKLDRQLSGLKRYLQSQPSQKIAIANPQHAPYGRAASAYMQQHNVWTLAGPYLVQAENADQLTQFTLTGNVAVGFIPLSHALQTAVASQGHYLKLPLILEQWGVVTSRASADAEKFVAFLQTDKARSHFRQQGFVVPGDR